MLISDRFFQYLSHFKTLNTNKKHFLNFNFKITPFMPCKYSPNKQGLLACLFSMKILVLPFAQC